MESPNRPGRGDPAGPRHSESRSSGRKKEEVWLKPEEYREPFLRSTACAVNLILFFAGRHFEAGKFRLELRKLLGGLGACPPPVSPRRA